MSLTSTDPQRLVEAVAAWLQYEQLCRRVELFGESYLTYPVGQFLQAREPRGLRSEFRHPILAPLQTKRGDKKRVDYVVLRDDGTVKFAVETKWRSKSSNLLESIIGDLVRLELLAEAHGTTSLLVLGGLRNKTEAIFNTKAFLPHPKQPNSNMLLPVVESQVNGTVWLESTSKFRFPLLKRALKPFKDIHVPRSIKVSRLGPFPKKGRKNQVAVFGFRVRPAETGTFIPSEHYDYGK